MKIGYLVVGSVMFFGCASQPSIKVNAPQPETIPAVVSAQAQQTAAQVQPTAGEVLDVTIVAAGVAKDCALVKLEEFETYIAEKVETYKTSHPEMVANYQGVLDKVRAKIRFYRAKLAAEVAGK